MSHHPDLMQILTDYALRELTFSDLYTPISSSKTILPLLFDFLQSSVPYVRQRQAAGNFYETHRATAFLLPSAFIIRCRATRRDECLLPVIYRSLFLLAIHLRSSIVRSPFPFRCAPFVSPGPPLTRALINFLDGAHYRPDCRQIPTPRRDT